MFLRLHNLPHVATSMDIRKFFHDCDIPPGAIQIFGGPNNEAFIWFNTKTDLIVALARNGQHILGEPVRLFLALEGDETDDSVAMAAGILTPEDQLWEFNELPTTTVGKIQEAEEYVGQGQSGFTPTQHPLIEVPVKAPSLESWPDSVPPWLRLDKIDTVDTLRHNDTIRDDIGSKQSESSPNVPKYRKYGMPFVFGSTHTDKSIKGSGIECKGSETSSEACRDRDDRDNSKSRKKHLSQNDRVYTDEGRGSRKHRHINVSDRTSIEKGKNLDHCSKMDSGYRHDDRKNCDTRHISKGHKDISGHDKKHRSSRAHYDRDCNVFHNRRDDGETDRVKRHHDELHHDDRNCDDGNKYGKRHIGEKSRFDRSSDNNYLKDHFKKERNERCEQKSSVKRDRKDKKSHDIHRDEKLYDERCLEGYNDEMKVKSGERSKRKPSKFSDISPKSSSIDPTPSVLVSPSPLVSVQCLPEPVLKHKEEMLKKAIMTVQKKIEKKSQSLNLTGPSLHQPGHQSLKSDSGFPTYVNKIRFYLCLKDIESNTARSGFGCPPSAVRVWDQYPDADGVIFAYHSWTKNIALIVYGDRLDRAKALIRDKRTFLISVEEAHEELFKVMRGGGPVCFTDTEGNHKVLTDAQANAMGIEKVTKPITPLNKYADVWYLELSTMVTPVVWQQLGGTSGKVSEVISISKSLQGKQCATTSVFVAFPNWQDLDTALKTNHTWNFRSKTYTYMNMCSLAKSDHIQATSIKAYTYSAKDSQINASVQTCNIPTQTVTKKKKRGLKLPQKTQLGSRAKRTSEASTTQPTNKKRSQTVTSKRKYWMTIPGSKERIRDAKKRKREKIQKRKEALMAINGPIVISNFLNALK